MDTLTKKTRLRAPNFTSAECHRLWSILEKYKDVIENKKTDGASLLEKHRAWMMVTHDYNNSTDTVQYSRTLESLHQCYKNLKKKRKKELSSSTMEIPAELDTCEIDNSWQDISLESTSCQNDSNIKEELDEDHGTDTEEDPLCSDSGAQIQIISEDIGSYKGDGGVEACSSTDPVEPVNTTPHHLRNHDRSSYSNGHSLRRKQMQRIISAKRRHTNGEYINDRFKTLAGEKIDLVKLQKQIVIKQLQIEDEKLSQAILDKEILKLKRIEEEEKLAHNRALRLIEIEETKKKVRHDDVLRKLELGNLLNN